MMHFNILISLLLIWNISLTSQLDFVVLRGDHGNTIKSNIVKRNVASDAPKIKEFIVKTFVANRFAETSVLSRVENVDSYAKQTAFSVVLPERAFISSFSMEIDGQTYKAFVKGKEDAEKIYDHSVASGQTAAHVAVSTRNANRFTVNINVEPSSKVNFYLTYEELLQREKGQYEIIANIQPGQVVKKLMVEVIIKESSPLLFVRTPSLRSGNKPMANNIDLDPHASIKISNTSAIVRFYPDINRQLQFACAGLGNTEYDGFAGQFVVLYDIERGSQSGETLFQDGFFLNFFAPTNLEPIAKHIVFVLDTSGSMSGTKITQLKDAMMRILPQLYPDDVFNIVQYSETAKVWDVNLNAVDAIPSFPSYGNLAIQLEQMSIPGEIPATPENIETAKDIINNFRDDGSTNTIGALEVALYLIKVVQRKHQGLYEPILVFLTDGLPNEGITVPAEIISLISNINSREYNTPIYSVSIGNDSDWKFLRQLSESSKGKPTRIHVDNLGNSDVSDQLKEFYSKIGTPVLSNVTFKNLPVSTQFTQLYFPLFFNGSEVVIAGKGVSASSIKPIKMLAKGKNGTLELEAKIGIPLTRLERVWAYLTVKQLLDQSHATSLQSNITELQKLALDLALNYSLVTEVTSLVVVKPNGVNTAISAVDASVGIFAKPANELPMCNNITEWTIKNFGTPEPTTMETTTEVTTEPITTTVSTTTPSTTTTRTTTTPSTTTTRSTTTSTTTVATTTEAEVVPESDFGIKVPTILPITTTESISVYQRFLTTCANMPFGCCRDGVTAATGYNYSGCDPIPKSESCSLPQSKGKCDISSVRWSMKWSYYPSLGECRRFWYSGCGGTDNRFGSKQDCEKVCINPTGLDRCKLPIVLGNCATYELNWFYDQKTDDCIKLMYSGCSGNSNRFSTKLECLQLCAPPSKRMTRQDACSMPMSKGTCRRFDRHFYYDSRYEACRTFWYGGCGGNDNRFVTQQECEKVCINPDGQDVCNLPPAKGLCQGSQKRWFFDKNSKTCSHFNFTGCRGNKNNFESREDCHKYCISGSTANLQESCVLKQDMGPCANYTIKWSFNRKKGQCVRFWYGGCEGNDNRFDTQEKCKEICVNPPGKDVCKLPKVPGTCNENLKRWYFDKHKKRCKEFVYNGCLGNANNFLSLDECNKLCV